MGDGQADPQRQINIIRVRIGLAIISIVVVVAVAMMFVLGSTPGKAVMFAIALTAFARAFLLVRSLRRERRAGPGG